METNAVPDYDLKDNPTGCCPRFKPDGWDGQELHFDRKRFVKATTRSLFHVPLNMGRVFERTSKAIEDVGGYQEGDIIILSHDPSPWRSEHYFAVPKDIPGQEMAELSGDYLTKVFEGPFKDAPKWEKDLKEYVESHDKHLKKTYFFYTTCPKCAKVYGKNYVVGVAEVE